MQNRLHLMKYLFLSLTLLFAPAAFAQKNDARHFWVSAWVLAKNRCLAQKGSFASKAEATSNLHEAIKQQGYEYINDDNSYISAFASELQDGDNSLKEYCLFPVPTEEQKYYWFKKYYFDEWELGF